MLIILAGLPGVGKTTIARLLAKRLGAIHIRVDTIEQALRDSGVMNEEIEGKGYVVGYRIATENLRLGHTIIADSVNPWPLTREAWRQSAILAERPYLEVEIVCSNSAEHKLRAETRGSDISGLVGPTWEGICNRDYQPWVGERLVIDTSSTDPNSAADLIAQKIQ